MNINKAHPVEEVVSKSASSQRELEDGSYVLTWKGSVIYSGKKIISC